MDEHSDTQTPRPLIIERPDLQTLSQRWGYRSVTIMAWILWFYLFIPLLSFIAWVVGLSLIYRLMLQDLDVAEFWQLLATYGAGIGVLAGCYLLWAFYSYLRFRGPDTRSEVPNASADELGRLHNIDGVTIQHWQASDHLVVATDDLDRIFTRKRDRSD